MSGLHSPAHPSLLCTSPLAWQSLQDTLARCALIIPNPERNQHNQLSYTLTNATFPTLSLFFLCRTWAGYASGKGEALPVSSDDVHASNPSFQRASRA